MNSRGSYFVDNLPDDNVPYADFDAPVDSDNPKDSSATAIVTSALFELFELTGKCRWHDSLLELDLVVLYWMPNVDATNGSVLLLSLLVLSSV